MTRMARIKSSGERRCKSMNTSSGEGKLIRIGIIWLPRVELSLILWRQENFRRGASTVQNCFHPYEACNAKCDRTWDSFTFSTQLTSELFGCTGERLARMARAGAEWSFPRNG